MPDIRTIDHWLDGDKTQRYSQSRLMAQHNKAGSHERRFAILMNENFRLTGDLETWDSFWKKIVSLLTVRSHVYHTQIMQSEALGWAYRAWRREWRGRGKEFVSVEVLSERCASYISLRRQVLLFGRWMTVGLWLPGQLQTTSCVNQCLFVWLLDWVHGQLRPKPAYYAIARELRPITVGILRTVSSAVSFGAAVHIVNLGDEE